MGPRAKKGGDATRSLLVAGVTGLVGLVGVAHLVGRHARMLDGIKSKNKFHMKVTKIMLSQD